MHARESTECMRMGRSHGVRAPLVPTQWTDRTHGVPSSRGRPAESERETASRRRSSIRTAAGTLLPLVSGAAAPARWAGCGNMSGLHKRSRPSLPPEKSHPSLASVSRQKMGPS